MTEEPGKETQKHKFVMVIDLARCKNARKCVEKCQDAHHLPPFQELMKVYLIQETEESVPYWMPKPCFHCDRPLCVDACPVGATIKRPDGIVMIDKERCIGCKTCMTACPFSSRQFNRAYPTSTLIEQTNLPESKMPEAKGMVSKCDFCADMVAEGKVPHCVTACPMGVIYFGDRLVDRVTNSHETVSFAELIASHPEYFHLNDPGSKPSVFYLPPLNS